MSSNFCVIGAILFICGACYAQAPTSDVQVPTITNSPLKLEDSTPVILRTKQDLSSATVKVGDRVPFRVAKDVRVADLVVISRGADAWGLVTAVQPKKRKGQPGKLDIAIQSVQLVTGDNAGLRAEQHLEGQLRDVGTMADIPRAAIESFGVGIPIVFLSMLENGKGRPFACWDQMYGIFERGCHPGPNSLGMRSAGTGATQRAGYRHDFSGSNRDMGPSVRLLRQGCFGQVAALRLPESSVATGKIFFPLGR